MRLPHLGWINDGFANRSLLYPHGVWCRFFFRFSILFYAQGQRSDGWALWTIGDGDGLSWTRQGRRKYAPVTDGVVDDFPKTAWKLALVRKFKLNVFSAEIVGNLFSWFSYISVASRENGSLRCMKMIWFSFKMMKFCNKYYVREFFRTLSTRMFIVKTPILFLFSELKRNALPSKWLTAVRENHSIDCYMALLNQNIVFALSIWRFRNILTNLVKVFLVRMYTGVPLKKINTNVFFTVVFFWTVN